MLEGKVWERALLLSRYFDLDTLREIARELAIDLQGTRKGADRWPIAVKVAKSCTDDQLLTYWQDHISPSIDLFRGQWYTVSQKGKLRLKGSVEELKRDIQAALQQGGLKAYTFLKVLVEHDGTAEFKTIAREMEQLMDERVWPTYPLTLLKKFDLVFDTGSNRYPTKTLPGEILPIVKQELENVREEMEDMKEEKKRKQIVSTELARKEVKKVESMDQTLRQFLQAINLDEVTSFGRDLSIAELEEKFQEFFGESYMDPLLSLVQQYSIADAIILSPELKKTQLRTGFNLAFFGDPGTGKTFASVDVIKGSDIVPAFGIPGRNRYCSGMTPAAFIRLAEAYEGKRFNFLVPEFREWFTHSSSMAEYLKLALERKPIKYETAKETVNSYEFSSFFNVNYNVSVGQQSWNSLSRDSHFRALRDRLLCKLHRMTMDRYKAISDNQLDLLLRGKEQIKSFARKIRQHVAMIFALEQQGTPMIQTNLSQKQIKLNERVVHLLKRTRNELLSDVDQPPFSPRLEKRVLQLACSATLLEYFKTDETIIEVSDAAFNFAQKVFKEEIRTRIQEKM